MTPGEPGKTRGISKPKTEQRQKRKDLGIEPEKKRIG
jgi:hypothetical protein